MRLFLVQHGKAAPKAEDPERPLCTEGRLDVTQMAAFARAAGIQVHQIRHSGKLRAEETASILAEYLQPAGGVLPLPGLAPKDDPRPVAELLKRETRPLMLVGHMPFMERLASFLIVGDPAVPTVRFEQGGIVCLERDPQRWTWSVAWSVTPGLFPQE